MPVSRVNAKASIEKKSIENVRDFKIHANFTDRSQSLMSTE